MTNQDYIEAYKFEDKIITDFYKIKDNNGNIVNLDQIVNPFEIDNRQQCAPTDNQRNSPHCAGYSACTVLETLYWKNTGKLKQLDAHQVYSLAKQMDGQINCEGTFLGHSLSAAIQLCKDENGFDFLKNAKIGLFYNDGSMKTVENTKFLLKKYGILQVGFQIDQGWSKVTNENYYIKPYGRCLGGHAVNILGYSSEGFYILNQWSSNWGTKGYGIMDYNTFIQQLMYGAYIYNITF